MKIRKSYIILGLIFGYISGKLLVEKFDNRPIKLERHKTEQSVELYIAEHYPIGSEGDKLVVDLIRSGAECFTMNKNHQNFKSNAQFMSLEEDCEAITFCEYMIGFVSINPLTGYSISAYINRENKLVGYHATVFNLPN